MKFPLPPNTFPALNLTPDDSAALQGVADFFVQDTIKQYYEHIEVDGGVVDMKRWKKIKQREDVRVYRERSAMAVPQADDIGHNGDAPIKGVSQTMPLMLTVGTIQGNLDDVMYGALNPTTDAMKLKSAYVEDGFCDWAVLASIIKPTPDDPFRELSIKWTIKRHPFLVATVLRTRDTVYIESIGVTTSPNKGERIGYHLQHSIELPEIRELIDLNIVRAKISFCHLFRQRKENVVEVFVRGLICPMGDAPASLAALTSAEVSVSLWKNVQCAQMKKLAWLTRTDRSSSTATQSQSSGCGVCTRSLKPTGLSRMKSSSGKDTTCRICLDRLCSKCSVTHTMYFTTKYSDEVMQRKATFCISCIQRANQLPAAHIATSDILDPDMSFSDFSIISNRLSKDSNSSLVSTEQSLYGSQMH
uniref:FYVE-type domain-containing protein n=1 Tax=Globisporangium ultimum (strain ATCC 200006 / CBS 805.95 / DAOM BR144) TaxID=431595 RepID=K3W6A8_GLOUD